MVAVCDQVESHADVRELLAQMRQEMTQLRAQVEGLQRENLELRQQAGYWKSRHADALERIDKLQQENESLRAEIRKLNDRLFGRKSEKQSTKDRSNQLDDPQETDQTEKKKRGQQPGRPGPPRRDYSHLPVRPDPVIELPEEQQVCPQCGQPLAEMSQTEDSEQIEIEIQVYRRLIRRRRYRRTCQCQGCAATVTTPAPPKLIPKGRYGVSMWVEILLSKFSGHQPTERLRDQLRLLDLDLAGGTITDGLKHLEPLFTPLYEALRERNRRSPFKQADETRWLVFVLWDGKTGYRWWLWVFLGPDTVVYLLDPSRSHTVPENYYPPQASGVLLVDRYSAYKAMAQVTAGNLLLAFCWAHVRRDFVEVGKSWEELRDWALAWLKRIRTLYRLHRQRLHYPADSAEFAAADALLREQVEAMRQEAERQLADPKLRAPCRQKLESLQAHWEGLTRFVDDPRIPMDNNGSERQLRGPAMGRKNYYGSGAVWSGRLAAMLFSLLATLRLWNLNPRRWLKWYLDSCAAAGGKAPPDIQPFLPWNLSEERKAELSLDPGVRSVPAKAAEAPDTS